MLDNPGWQPYRDERRERLERFARTIAEVKRRLARREQSRRGWYDEHGIRQGGLIAFVRHFWKVLEPETPLIDGWPLWAMCEHLEAVTAGEITRLLMNVPPGFMKSLLTDVFWPAWEWGPMDMAHLRYVAFSYASTLTERDNERFRDLVCCDEYQAMYSDRVQVPRGLRSGVGRISNTKRGWKFASSVGGVGTGERGDRIVLDDPHNIKDGESETIRSETVRWFREAMSNRLNDQSKGAVVIIMQRVHEDDVSGAILDNGLDYVHLCIPMEYDWERQTDEDGNAIATAIGWVDPRHVPLAEGGPEECDGVLAWPERFDPETVARTQRDIGPYGWAGQYSQAPAPRGGGLFKKAWWQLWDTPDGRFPAVEYVLASLDSAFTEKETNDPSGLTVWGVFKERESGQKRIILLHAWRKFLEFSGPRIERQTNESDNAYRLRTRETWGLIEWVADTCNRFKVDLLLIEAKASGMSAGQELQNRYQRRDWAVQLCPVRGDKFSRALRVQSMFSQLMIYAPVRDWSDMVIDEMSTFPKGKYRDLTDSTSQALQHLRDVGLLQLDEEVRAAEIDGLTHKPRTRLPYAV